VRTITAQCIAANLIGSRDVAHPKMRLAMLEPAPYITYVTEFTGAANGFPEIA
jgi:hypothetical protein